MRHQTLRSDFMPSPAKIGSNRRERTGIPRWRVNIKSNDRRRTAAARLFASGLNTRKMRVPAAARNGIRVRVSNQVGKRRNISSDSVDGTGRSYEFQKYLEALKYEESATTSSVPTTAKGISLKKASPTRKDQEKPKQEGENMEVEDGGSVLDGNRDGESEERKIQLVKTTIVIPQAMQSDVVRHKQSNRKRQIRPLYIHRPTQNPAMKADTGKGPSARLFLHSLPL